MAPGHSDHLIRVVGAVAQRGDRVFMARRPPGRAHAGLWEFPGGKVEPGEDDATALARELREELQIDAIVGELLAVGHDDRVALWCYRCSWSDEPRPTEGQAVRWIPLAELSGLAVPPADAAAVQALTAAQGKVC